ncbi:MAG: glycosyltransferase family 4 protein [Bacteroidetes bacterium]|nr:glycosyltransferase family 4 protein [Bacteroidota bacterium]
MKNKKIVFLVPDAGIFYEQSAGAGTHIRGTVSGFRSNHIDVLPIIGGDIFGIRSEVIVSATVVQESTMRKFIKKIVPDKLKLFYRDLRRVYLDYKFENKIIKQIKQYDPDAIYERSALYSTCGIRLSKKLNIPLIIESDGCMPEIISMDFGLFSVRLANLVEKYKLKKANYVSAYNQFSKQFLAKKFDLPVDKIIVKPLGISVNNSLVSEIEADSLKQKYDLLNKKVVGFVGAISKYHGVDLLIECASFLHNKNITDIVIVIVGWSKEAEELNLKAQKLNLPNVVFTGRVDKKLIPVYYKIFDVGVIPNSEPTIYPVKVLEYGAYGLCPIVPDYVVFNEIITDKVHGLYFQKNDPHSLADLLVSTFETATYNAIAKNWEQKVLSDCTWKSSVKELVTVVNNTKK